ncbi:tumor necrosis factor receptor superfamily member 10A-like isoform X2 [Hippocampus comes]|uniref:tumor necrosis factor receptor superfamily member 10A-like isoform X2 n=1 Tax=Hippocampus comes TaxID=109280 RepID=UPI00094F0AB6|nr:PREDICTED: tumor necrosis factor receptor superfamily member 10A-like isoform X2 [Hippocampus comes]
MNTIPFVIFVLIWSFASTATFPRGGQDSQSIWTRHEAICRDGEYWNGKICCLNCPPGTYLKSACTAPGEKGQCEKCADETYTQHANDLKQCITCTKCRPDQEIVWPCNRTQNTKCQCKEGRFCAPEHACEMCNKCSRCEKDEKVVRNCSATSNTECKKIPLQSDSASGNTAIIVCSVLLVLFLLCGLIYWCTKKLARVLDNLGGCIFPLGSEENELKVEHALEGNNEQSQKPGCSSLIFSQPRVRGQSSATMEDECQALCESHNSSANNSQQNLTSLPPAFPASAHRASLTAIQPDLREDEPFPELIPINGEESLRRCFQYFEEVDIDYYKRFFRQLELNSNVIKSKDPLLYEDRIHELLNIWLEKEGKDASLNDLLKALLKFDQRRTAEIIKAKALKNGHYVLEN